MEQYYAFKSHKGLVYGTIRTNIKSIMLSDTSQSVTEDHKLWYDCTYRKCSEQASPYATETIRGCQGLGRAEWGVTLSDLGLPFGEMKMS